VIPIRVSLIERRSKGTRKSRVRCPSRQVRIATSAISLMALIAWFGFGGRGADAEQS
jgi:hypothetical protein